MSENKPFRSKEEELERLTREIAELKDAARQISNALGKIERHVMRSFGVEKKKKSEKNPRPRSPEKGEDETPSITPSEALQLFDKLSSPEMRSKPVEIERRLLSLSHPDLKLVAHELGLTFKSKPSKKTLCEGVIRRLNERSMLSRNLNTTTPRRQGPETDDSGGKSGI